MCQFIKCHKVGRFLVARDYNKNNKRKVAEMYLLEQCSTPTLPKNNISNKLKYMGIVPLCKLSQGLLFFSVDLL